MLPKHHRLKRSRDFSRVYRLGRKGASAHFLVRVLPSSPEAQPIQAGPSLWNSANVPDQIPRPAPRRAQAESTQIGIVVSQKVSKRAVVRNRLKRQVRAIVTSLLPRLRPQLWVVITLRPGADQCEYGEFLRELEQLFTQLEVIHGHS